MTRSVLGGVRRSLTALVASSFAFSFALGVGTVSLPLVALDQGYSGSAVGVLTALSAVAQIAARATLGRALSRYPDRLLVVAAAAMLAVSCALVAMSATVVPFVVAELLQGAARGCFWTGSQSHAVRSSASSVRGMAGLNLTSSTGLLAGPVVAGLLGELDLRWPLWVAAGAAVVATALAARLPGHPPYRPPLRPADQPLWRHPAVVAAGWTGATAGAWRGLLASYVPVVLERAGQGSAAIGALVAAANAASIAGSGLAGRRRVVTTGALTTCTLATGLGLSAAALSAEAALVCCLALVVSGVGAGGLQTFGPALAADGVHPEERGLAIASTGTYRAVALFVAPMAVAGLVLALPAATALAVAGLVATAPSLAARRRTEDT